MWCLDSVSSACTSLSSVEKYFAGISPAEAHTQTYEQKNRDFSIVHHLSLLLFFLKSVYGKVFEPIEMLKANKNNRLVTFFAPMFMSLCVYVCDVI